MADIIPLTANPTPDTQPSTMTPQNIALPRIVIKFCTQCRWMLRAAYFAQELLSTFNTAIGEIALQPTTGGIFRVELTYDPEYPAARTSDAAEADKQVAVKEVLLWDRKAEGGFPETKVLKQRVRDYLEPNRDLGHSDKGGKKKEVEQGNQEGKELKTGQAGGQQSSAKEKVEKKEECLDCK